MKYEISHIRDLADNKRNFYVVIKKGHVQEIKGTTSTTETEIESIVDELLENARLLEEQDEKIANALLPTEDNP
tara:strand:- start:119 stop:340 length:222 start_codon:yes stop_codon:yes gene_type:complete